MGPLIIVALGLGAAGVYAFTRETSDQAQLPSAFANLQKGQLYRVWARVDKGYVSTFRASHPGQEQQNQLGEDLKNRLQTIGFYPVLLATQDPSDSAVWTFLARWTEPSKDTVKAPFAITKMEPVVNPPETMIPPVDPPINLDDGLLLDEIDAIRYALSRDEDPKHLTGFASVLSPEFPISASLLNVKATLVSAQNRASVIIGQATERRQEIRRRYETATAVVNFAGVFDWVEDRAEDALDALKKATEDLGQTVQDMWDKYGGIVEVMGGWVPGPQIWAIETAYKVAKDINEGRPVGNAIPERLSEQGARFAKGMQATSPFVAMIPGLGTGVAMMMNASAALALAQPLDEAAIDTISLAIPGGAVAQQGFRSAAYFGSGMLRGESWDEAAVAAARDVVKKQIGDAGAVAFDAGLALARGKSLQQAGFAALYQLTKGNDLADRAAHLAEALVVAKQQGRSLKAILIDQMSSALEQYGRAEALKRVNQLADYIQRDGRLLQMFPKELAEKYGVAEDIALAAQASVKEISEGVRIIDADIIKRLTPPTTVSTLATKVNPLAVASTPVQATSVNRLTYASPTALKMVEATRRPEASLVVDPESVVKRIAEVNAAAKAGDEEARKAQEALERARRDLERRKWVEWYRRQMQLEAGEQMG